MIWKIILLLFTLPIMLALGAILGNGVALSEAPGVKERMSVFLTGNVAELSPGHTFPELRNPEYHWSAAELERRATQAVTELGWLLEPEKDGLHAVVITPLIGFKDDVLIHAESLSDGRSRLHVRSSSRVGKADFAANLRHVNELIAKIGADK